MTDVPFTRASFIADDHVQIAIAGLETIWSYDEGGVLKEVPMPPSIKETGLLPEGYGVAFASDPITMVHSLASIGIINESQLKKEAFDELKVVANAPGNLQIVPVDVRDSKLEATIKSLGPLPAAADKSS